MTSIWVLQNKSRSCRCCARWTRWHCVFTKHNTAGSQFLLGRLQGKRCVGLVLFVLRREFSSKIPIKAVLSAFAQSHTAAQALLLSLQKINTTISLLIQLHCEVMDVNSVLLDFSTCPKPPAASWTPVTHPPLHPGEQDTEEGQSWEIWEGCSPSNQRKKKIAAEDDYFIIFHLLQGQFKPHLLIKILQGIQAAWTCTVSWLLSWHNHRNHTAHAEVFLNV